MDVSLIAAFMAASGSLIDTAFAHDLANPLLWSGMLFYAAPLLFAAVGGVVSERAGVVNIGMEGMMLMGAFFSAFAVDKLIAGLGLADWVGTSGGIVAALLAGGLTASVLAVLAVCLRANQIVVGMGINLVALGLTSYLFYTLYPVGPPTDLPGITPVHIPGLSDLTVLDLGHIVFSQSPLFYLAVLAALLIQGVLFRTKVGLRLRSVGEHPIAAKSVGVSVLRYRVLAVVVSGCLCGLGGSFLVMNGSPPLFAENITQGRGFIALAAVIVGKWTPGGAAVACLLFGFGQSMSVILEGSTVGSFTVSDYLLAMLPYVIALVVVAGLIGRSTPPAADGVPYDPASAG